MKTIGILGKGIEDSYIFNYKYINKLLDVNCIGLFSTSDYSICDGFLIQGGKNIESWFYDVIDYAIKNKKPILGICLGCQVLGTYKSGSLKKINNHNGINHLITINNSSFLYKLFGKNIYVNSKHDEAIDKLSDEFEISSISSDGVIEAIEYKDKNLFIVGIQWHPEELSYMDSIFDKFISRL